MISGPHILWLTSHQTWNFPTRAPYFGASLCLMLKKKRKADSLSGHASHWLWEHQLAEFKFTFFCSFLLFRLFWVSLFVCFVFGQLTFLQFWLFPSACSIVQGSKPIRKCALTSWELDTWAHQDHTGGMPRWAVKWECSLRKHPYEQASGRRQPPSTDAYLALWLREKDPIFSGSPLFSTVPDF